MNQTQNSPEALAALQLFIAENTARAWVPPYRGRITEYASKIDLQENVFAVKGLIKLSGLRHLIEPLEAIYNPAVRLCSIMGAVQTTKSLICDIIVPYWIEHDPGDILWLFEDDPKAKKYADERAMPLIRSIAGIYRMLQDVDRRHKTMTRLKFAHCTLTFAGLNEGNVQTFPYRYVIIDEAWMARANGLIRQAMDRTRQYRDTCKIVILGQGGWEDEDHDKIHKQTDDRVLEFACPMCGFHQPFELSRLRGEDFPTVNLRGTYAGLSWDTNEKTRPNGRYDLSEVGNTAHYRCYQCDGRIEDTKETRRKLMDSYTYRATNLKAEPGKVGFRWPSEASTRLPFKDQVVKYLRAKMEKDEMGYDLSMQEFYQKDRGISWSEIIESGYRPISSGDYDVNSEWKDEWRRVLIGDCQKDLKKFHIGAFALALNGEARELARETVESFDDIAAFQKKWKVDDQRVFLDCGYEMTKVLRECVQRGHVGFVTQNKRKVSVWKCWTGLKGSGQETFAHRHPRTELAENRIYSPRKFYDVNIGTTGKHPRAPYYEWSNLHCKDLARARRDGDAGIPKFLTLPDKLPNTDQWSYEQQMRSEKRTTEFRNGRKVSIWEPIKETRPNHEWDKAAMLMAVMAICGIIGNTQSEQEAG